MTKDKKSPEETASVFNSMVKASVSGNPKPKKKRTKKDKPKPKE